MTFDPLLEMVGVPDYVIPTAAAVNHECKTGGAKWQDSEEHPRETGSTQEGTGRSSTKGQTNS